MHRAQSFSMHFIRLRQFRNRFQGQLNQSAVDDPISATDMRSVPTSTIDFVAILVELFDVASGKASENRLPRGKEAALLNTVRSARLCPLSSMISKTFQSGSV